MKSMFVLAGALVLGVSSTSFADLTFASNVSLSNSDGQLGSNLDSNANGAPDRVFQTTVSTGTFSRSAQLVLSALFQNSGGDVGLVIYTGSPSGLTLTLNRIDIGTNNGGTAFLSGLTQALLPAGTAGDFRRNVITGAGNQTSYTTAGNFAWTDVRSVTLTFTVTGAAGSGQSFQIDAISNPEPGALALFGLGAIGLGGLVWKRTRRTRAVSAR